jgi:gas vesicle protein
MEIMDVLVGVIVVGFVGWMTLEVFFPKKAKEEPETKIEPAKKIESDFVTGLTVEKAKEEVKATTAIEDIKADMAAKTDEAFVKAMVEAATKVEDAIVAEGKESAAELVKVVEPVVEEVKKKTRTVKAKAKAIEEVVEAKTEQLEKAVKKTKAKKNG